jgi:hypothetical protein
MAQRPIAKVSDRWFAQLNATVTSGATTWVLKSSGATGLPDISAIQQTILHCGSEKVLVTAVAVDTPSAGLDTLTVTRGYGGTTAAAHSADAAVGMYFYEDYYNDVAERIAQLERFIYGVIGASDGVVQDGGLQVVATGTPGMTVQVTPGAAVVDGHPVALRATYTTAAFTAPTGGNKRIDCIRIDQNGLISVVTGTPSGSPSAPAVGTGYLKRAEIYLRTGSTSIKDTDDTTNGYITITDNYL